MFSFDDLLPIDTKKMKEVMDERGGVAEYAV
jgi:hypothetical protein